MSERETGEIHKQEEEEKLSCFDANWAAAAPPTIMDQSIEKTSTKKNLASRKYKPISSTFHDKFHYMVKLSRTSKMIHRVRIILQKN